MSSFNVTSSFKWVNIVISTKPVLRGEIVSDRFPTKISLSGQSPGVKPVPLQRVLSDTRCGVVADVSWVTDEARAVMAASDTDLGFILVSPTGSCLAVATDLVTATKWAALDVKHFRYYYLCGARAFPSCCVNPDVVDITADLDSSDTSSASEPAYGRLRPRGDSTEVVEHGEYILDVIDRDTTQCLRDNWRLRCRERQAPRLYTTRRVSPDSAWADVTLANFDHASLRPDIIRKLNTTLGTKTLSCIGTIPYSTRSPIPLVANGGGFTLPVAGHCTSFIGAMDMSASAKEAQSADLAVVVIVPVADQCENYAARLSKTLFDVPVGFDVGPDLLDAPFNASEFKVHMNAQITGFTPYNTMLMKEGARPNAGVSVPIVTVPVCGVTTTDYDIQGFKHKVLAAITYLHKAGVNRFLYTTNINEACSLLIMTRLLQVLMASSFEDTENYVLFCKRELRIATPSAAMWAMMSPTTANPEH